MKLYDCAPSGNSYKVRLLLSWLQRPYERIAVDIFSGEARTPIMRQRNVAGRVPILELHDGTMIAESNAILTYLADETEYLPSDRLGRVEILRWMFFEQNEIEPTLAVMRFAARWGDPSATPMEWLRARGNRGLRTMEKHLEGHKFFGAERPTIADIALYAYTHVAGEGGMDLLAYPGVQGWLGRVAAHPYHVPIDAET